MNTVTLVKEKISYHPRPILDDDSDTYYAVPTTVTTLSKDGGHLVRSYDADGDLVDLPDDFIELSYDWDESCRILAVRISIDEWDGDATCDDDRVWIGKRSWLAVTDDEADELWDQELENYLDECVLGDLPEISKSYFDKEKWKSDARIDGRAHSLSRYDGNEDSVDIEGYAEIYVYRLD